MRRVQPPEIVVAGLAGLLLIGTIFGALHDPDDDHGPPASAAGTAVEIDSFQFAPRELSVATGDTVTWTNLDSAKHAIKGEGNTPAQSEDLDQGETYEFTFDQPGTYPYICSIHTSMRGTVVVGAD